MRKTLTILLLAITFAAGAQEKKESKIDTLPPGENVPILSLSDIKEYEKFLYGKVSLEEFKAFTSLVYFIYNNKVNVIVEDKKKKFKEKK